MNPAVKASLKVLGYDPAPMPSEIYPEIARRRILEAVASCEVWKARGEIRAKLMIQKMNQRRSGK